MKNEKCALRFMAAEPPLHRSRKASGIFCAYFQSAILIDAKCQKHRVGGI